MSELTENQKLTALKKDYMKMFECDQNGKSKFTLIKGDKKKFSNCVLIILPHVTSSGFMNAEYEKKNLIGTLQKYKIDNYIIAYAQPNKTNSASRKLIKKSRELMGTLIEIIQPKLIITLDDTAADLFCNQKPNIIEAHGTEITNYFDIPIYLTYNMDYYITRTGYEDDRYKAQIYEEDWTNISARYQALIV